MEDPPAVTLSSSPNANAGLAALQRDKESSADALKINIPPPPNAKAEPREKEKWVDKFIAAANRSLPKRPSLQSEPEGRPVFEATLTAVNHTDDTDTPVAEYKVGPFSSYADVSPCVSA